MRSIGPIPVPTPGQTLRMARMSAALAALPSATAVGVAVAALRGDKRSGVDAVLPPWLDWYLATGGVTVEVVAGRAHLRKPRPAVFVWNHKNNWDSMVTASLVRTRFTGVAKKELQKVPLMGTFGRFMDLCFIDRSGKLSAAEQLREVEDLARKGLSVLVAPEGTRSADGSLGPFKKGAFRIALATGLPIVPIVIRNAEVLGDSSSKMMGSGHIQVVVLPPVSPDDWSRADLPKRIEEVRSSFVDTLADWPNPPPRR
ncbi:MAG: 1-acyl-sn-glycerol-3-phosphate acyltransferase [Actinomycetota bacterium]|nr:1-acyl-sn-glycerol-3-phosphate acyltransferase [Actinomycetota bacterium]MDQ6947071.1 1-acyl-sn-glycerol-3-phosphate acyltransferase [Actinomycetota bacterium]